MKQIVYVSFLVCCTLHGIYGQDSSAIKAKRAIYLELGGTGQGISFSYDQFVGQRGAWTYGARAGIGAISFGQLRPTVFAEVYALKGKRGKYLELGIGLSYLFSVTSTYTTDSTLVTFRGADYLWLVPRIGYRKQSGKRGNVFRIGLTPPLMLQSGRWTVKPLIGLSVGQSF